MVVVVFSFKDNIVIIILLLKKKRWCCPKQIKNDELVVCKDHLTPQLKL